MTKVCSTCKHCEGDEVCTICYLSPLTGIPTGWELDKPKRIDSQTLIEDWDLNWNLGSVIKAIERDDLYKALWYIRREMYRRSKHED